MEHIEVPGLLISSAKEYSFFGNDAMKKLSYKDWSSLNSEKDICFSIEVKITGSNAVSFSKGLNGTIFISSLFFLGVVCLFWENPFSLLFSGSSVFTINFLIY